VKAVYVWQTKLVPGIVSALVDEDIDVLELLPELTLLHLAGYRKSSSVAEAAEQFVAMRNLAGHPVSLTG